MDVFENADIELVPLTVEDLSDIALSSPADALASALDGALPPPHVAIRALSQLEAGTSAAWCVPFLIVAKPSGAILGGCGFKGFPVDGDVEIGYGVAKSARRRGVATLAVTELLGLAAASGIVRQVVAHILPDNDASSGVVSRLGFSRGLTIVDPDGEVVVRWVYPIAT
jgi:ribosomal-protein-alanine N-acetyltransferase